MNKNEELLQRCFDSDLDDKEMKNLFAEMSKDESLRKLFRSMQTLRDELRSFSTINIPATLDERIKLLSLSPHLKFLPSKSALRRAVNKKFTVSIPAFAATILLLIVGSYFAATNIFVQKPKTEYVYVVEMPAYVVQSNYQKIKIN